MTMPVQPTDRTDRADAVQYLGKLVAQFGLAYVVSTLADLAHEHSDRLLVSGQRQEATLYAHGFRVLDRAVAQLKK